MTHFFLSPHPDDVVLSCGGVIVQLVQAGEPVVVQTVMAGDLPSDVVISPFIQEHVARWGLGPPDPVPGRKAEDERAVRLLGGIVQFGGFPDALYRTDGQGKALYPDRDALFAAISPHDPVLGRIHEITDRLKLNKVVYAPLGAGHHVDHQLVRDAVVAWCRSIPEVAVFFYEEYPYSAASPDVVQAARAALGWPTVPVMHRLHDAALDAKIAAIACYESQINTFWADVPEMADATRQYAAQVGDGQYAERFWRLVLS